MSKTLSDLESELIQEEDLLLEGMEELRKCKESNRIYFFKPYAWMYRALDLISKYNISVCPAPNKIGKTALACCVADSWCRGYELWSKVDKDSPGAVRSGDSYFKPSSLGIAPPVRVRISGEDWYKHFGETFIPEMKKWLPKGDYDTKKNSMGFEYKWIHRETKSTIELITYNQDSSSSESWMGHAWISDEPPPRDMYIGMSRGIFLNNGKVFMATTPVKEAWILDELILSGRKDVGILNDLTILANDDLYGHDTKVLRGMGVDREHALEFFDMLLFKDKKKRIFVDDRGRSSEMFLEKRVAAEKQGDIQKLSLLRFVKDTPENEASTRFGGEFKSLAGRVVKEFDKSKHWIEPFPIPTDWPVIAMIDFHLNKPHAISYHAVSKQGVFFIIKEIYENMTTEEIADSIIRDKNLNSWNIKEAQIDPLSKGDTSYMRNRIGVDIDDSYSIIKNRLYPHGIELSVGSKDKSSGVQNINAELQGVNGVPISFIFDTCKRHYTEIMRWVYDEVGKPAKGKAEDYDDMMENWYRRTLSGLRYDHIGDINYYEPESTNANEEAWMGI